MVLLVEDDAMDVELFEKAWEYIGSKGEICIANWGEKAIEMAKILPNLVILDLNLPGLDGFEVLKELKNDPFTKWIPVVILTSSPKEEDCKRCYELGANAYVVKPSSFKELVELAKTIRDFWLFFNKIPKGVQFEY